MAGSSSFSTMLDASIVEYARMVSKKNTGPEVSIRVGNTPSTYTIPKVLLCSQSKYVAAMFNGSFQEGETQGATVTQEEGVVSNQSFKLLLQWIYSGRVTFPDMTLVESISSAIELARFADMADVAGVGPAMAERIKAILLERPDPNDSTHKNPDRYTRTMEREHLLAASFLPQGHAVRCVLAAAGVVACDLLVEVKAVLKIVSIDFKFTEPLGGEKVLFVNVG